MLIIAVMKESEELHTRVDISQNGCSVNVHPSSQPLSRHLSYRAEHAAAAICRVTWRTFSELQIVKLYNIEKRGALTYTVSSKMVSEGQQNVNYKSYFICGYSVFGKRFRENTEGN
jgi:hypothetical protein